MDKSALSWKFQNYLTLEKELSKDFAHYLWSQFPFKDRLEIEYAESYADNYWIVGLTPRGLYFEAYAWEEFSRISKELGLNPGEYSFDPVFTQDIRFFEKLPFHVLRYLYTQLEQTK